MQTTQQEREAKAEAWKRSLAAQLAAKHDQEDKEMRRNLYIAIALFVCGCTVIGGCLVRTAADTGALGPAVDASGPPDIWATDGTGEQEDAGAIPVLARPMPDKPFEGQKRPPCNGKFEVAHNGGCWVAIEGKPGPEACGPSYFEKGGKCYLPVKQAKRPPTSVDE